MKTLIAGLGAALSLVACGGTPTCVARGSRVATPRGARRIEELREGDTIVVVDPTSGLTAESRIVRIVSNHREVGLLSMGGASLSLTSDHPVYDPIAKDFFPAGDWLLGQRTVLLQLAEDGVREVPVSRAESFVGVAEVFDLTVEHPWHTFVAEGVVVHNKSVAHSCASDAGTVLDGTTCQCAEGTGRVTCDLPGEAARCEFCVLPDGGTPDAGP